MNKSVKKLEVDKTFIEEVIITTTERRGKGIEGDPIRVITKVYLKNGELIAEDDPCQTLNDDKVGEGYKENFAMMMPTQATQLYTAQQLEQAEERAWQASRLMMYKDAIPRECDYCFKTFQDYKQSKQSLSSNAAAGETVTVTLKPQPKFADSVTIRLSKEQSDKFFDDLQNLDKNVPPSNAQGKDWEIITCKMPTGEIHFYAEEYCLGANKNVPVCTIHSVKRLSDNEVFTIGDPLVMRYNTNDDKIMDITLEEDIWFENKKEGWGIRIDSAKKQKINK